MSKIKNKTGDVKPKNIDSSSKYKRAISVYACPSDVHHPKVLSLAVQAGLLKKDRYDLILNGSGENKLDNNELSTILENYFGFNKGDYVEEVIEGIQQTRFREVAVGEVRYIGEERIDSEWCSTGLASQEATEFCKFGGTVDI